MKTKKLLQALFKIIFAFPLAFLVKIPLLGGSLNLLDLEIIAFLGLSVFCLFYQPFFRGKFFSFLMSSRVFCGGALVGTGATIAFILNAFPQNIFNSLGALKSFILLPIAFSLLAAFWLKQKFLKFQTVFIAQSYFATILAVAALLVPFQDKFSYDHRLKLFFQSPNQLAIFLALGFLATFFCFLRQLHSFSRHHSSYHWLFSRDFFLLTAIIIFITLWQTASTGAIIASGLAAGIILLFYWLRRLFLEIKLGKIILLLSLLASTAILVFSHWPLVTSPPASLPFPSSLDSRIAIYSASKKILQKNWHWLFGIGPYNFQDNYLAVQSLFVPYPQWAVPHAHNLWLQTWLEAGLLGLLGLLFAFKAIFTVNLLPQKDNHVISSHLNQKAPFRLALWGWLFYFLLHGVIDAPAWGNAYALFFWFTLFSLELNSVKTTTSPINKE